MKFNAILLLPLLAALSACTVHREMAVPFVANDGSVQSVTTERLYASLGGNVEAIIPGQHGSAIYGVNNSKAFGIAGATAFGINGVNKLAEYGIAKLENAVSLKGTADATKAAELAAGVEQAKIANEVPLAEIAAEVAQ